MGYAEAWRYMFPTLYREVALHRWRVPFGSSLLVLQTGLARRGLTQPHSIAVIVVAIVVSACCQVVIWFADVDQVLFCHYVSQ